VRDTMLTVEEYILQMKKKDKLDEFNFRNHAENMTKVISYVMEYFNNYLDPEAYDYENIKTEQTIIKIKQDTEKDYPKSIGFIIDYYRNNKVRIDKTLKKWIEELRYFDLFYCYEDYEQAVNKFCNNYKMKNTGVEKYKEELIVLAQEIKIKVVEEPVLSNFKYIDNNLVRWILDTYRDYGVNLYEFAETISWEYYEKYVQHISSNYGQDYYNLNTYNHRYNDDAFTIGNIYKENEHRPFIMGKKGELEMLIMYDWIFYQVDDQEYWPEYVNLCVSFGKVSLSNNLNILIPVKNNGVDYPEDVISNLTYLETSDGILEEQPSSSYILRIIYKKDDDKIWRNENEMKSLVKNLNESFARYGEPYTLEFMSPFRTEDFNEEDFIIEYNKFEKSMKKFKNMKIAIVNGPAKKKLPHYIVESIEDIMKIKLVTKEAKSKLKLAIDLSKLEKQKQSYRYRINDLFDNLLKARSTIIGLHFGNILTKKYFAAIKNYDKKCENKYDYPRNSEFLEGIAALINDNQPRYFVPEEIKNGDDLEELVDSLLRVGCSFSTIGVQ
jgi:hypothetical protein